MTHLSLAVASNARAEHSKSQERVYRWSTAANAFWAGRHAHEELAKLLLVTPVAIEQMAAGYAIFLTLLKFDRARAWRCRQAYSYHRFFEVGKRWLTYEFNPEMVWDYLESNFSTRQVGMEIEDNHDPRPAWQRKAKRVVASLLIIRDDEQAPARVRELADELAEELK